MCNVPSDTVSSYKRSLFDDLGSVSGFKSGLKADWLNIHGGVTVLHWSDEAPCWPRISPIVLPLLFVDQHPCQCYSQCHSNNSSWNNSCKHKHKSLTCLTDPLCKPLYSAVPAQISVFSKKPLLSARKTNSESFTSQSEPSEVGCTESWGNK